MKRIYLLSVILLCSPMFSMANTQLTMSPSLLYFDYTEFSPTNDVLDREIGWLPGLELNLNHTITSEWAVNLFGAYYQGVVDYDGLTQSGTAVTTDTETRLFRLGGQVTKEVYNKTGLFIGAQFHQWNRDIQSNAIVSGLDEIYKWVEYSVGIKTDLVINQNNNINIDLAFLLIKNGSLDVDLSSVDLGSASLVLGDGTGSRLRLNWIRAVSNNIKYDMTLFIEAWGFGRSASELTQGGAVNVLVTEPRSETQNIGIKLNIEYVF